MDAALARGVRYMTAQLAVLAAAVHLVVAVPRLAAAVAGGTWPRLATMLFVLAVVGTVVGLVAARLGVALWLVYGLGLVLMLGQVGGWVVYHNLGILGFGHSHGGSLLANTVAHFVADPLEAAAVTAEAMAAVLLVVLWRGDPAVVRPRPGDLLARRRERRG